EPRLAATRSGAFGLRHLHRFKCYDIWFAQSREVGIDMLDAGDAADEVRRLEQVDSLLMLQEWLGQPQPGRIERAVLVRDEDHALQFMGINEKLEFIENALLCDMGLGVSCQA